MANKQITVIKRNGTKVPYSEDKIIAVIEKAFNATGEAVTPGQIKALAGSIKIYNGISVEEIQTDVQRTLMIAGFYKTAEAFILYRAEHAEDRETIEQLKFLTEYCKADNAASGSKYDANANVENKNIATLIGELPKKRFIRLNRKLLTDRIKKLYNKELADRYLDLLNKHFIYKNDETSIANYCASITMYPWLLNGTFDIGGNSKAPTNLKAFCGGFINMVFIVSSMLSGACATPEFLMYMDYFIRKEYGEDYWQHPEVQGDCSLRKRSIDKMITDCFEQIVYSINQPTGARNFQAVFWNIAYYDKYYFQSLFEDFYFPDGSKPCWESLSWLQKRFMTWFNKERTKTMLTFPVETMAMLSDGEKPKDSEWADFAAKMYAEGHSFFTYISDQADSLSSCCFSADTEVLWKSSVTGVHLTTLKELHDTKWEPYKKNLRIFHNGSWVSGKTIKLPKKNMYKVTTYNNKEFFMTEDHINVTLHGEKPTMALTTDDYLMFNTIAAQAIPEQDEHLTYEQGFAVGSFLGDGSFGATNPNTNTIYDIQFSQNIYKYEHCMEVIDKANQQVGGETKSHLSSIYNNVYPVRISSKYLAAFIQKWTNWKRGTYSYNKELNLNCLTQSYEFRKGILDGWYHTDGGNSNRCYTSSPKLAKCMEVLITSLGLQSIIDISDRTDENVIIRGETYNRNYPLYCVRWYEPRNHRRNKEPNKSWIKHNNSIYFRIKSIEPIEYNDDVYCIECNNPLEPYFTLPCGLITHNCRLRNEIQDNVFSYTLGAGGISTGSKSVLTINLNRCVQYAVNNNLDYLEFIADITDLCHKVQTAYNENLKELQKNGMLPLFDAGYINIKRQYLTIGINGMVEAAEFMGLTINNNDDYKHFVQGILSIIEKKNKEYRTDELMFNCEMIPAENVGVKHAKWDKEDGYIVPRDCYNSYFYIVEDTSLSVLDKFKLHGTPYIEHLTGGSALHMNLDEHLSQTQYRHLLDVAAKEGCNYFTFNIPNTVCNDCGHIDKRYLKECPICHSKNIDYLTRIIGYLKRISNFSKARQEEADRRYYANGKNELK